MKKERNFKKKDSLNGVETERAYNLLSRSSRLRRWLRMFLVGVP